MNFLNYKNNAGIGFLLSLFLLFSFSFVAGAVDTTLVTDVFQVNDVISYTKPCINNGTWCSAAASCNYTFYDRNNDIRYNNVVAENVGAGGASLWEYNISNINTGLYKVDMICADGSLRGSETLYYEVTGDGVNNSLGFYAIIILISMGIIVLGFAMTDAPITILGSFGLYFVSIYILFNGIAGTKDPVTTWGMGIILLGMAMYISTRSAYELIVD